MKKPKEIWIRTDEINLLTSQIKGKHFITTFLGHVLPLATEVKSNKDNQKVYLMNDNMKYTIPTVYGGEVDIMLYKNYLIILKF